MFYCQGRDPRQVNVVLLMKLIERIVRKVSKDESIVRTDQDVKTKFFIDKRVLLSFARLSIHYF